MKNGTGFRETVKLYQMEMHEVYSPAARNNSDLKSIIRVPGGWIYCFWRIAYSTGNGGVPRQQHFRNEIFIPFIKKEDA